MTITFLLQRTSFRKEEHQKEELTLARLIWLSKGSSGGFVSPNKAGATKLKPRNSSCAVALAGIPGESVVT